MIRRPAAFTLIELLFVVAIIGVLAAISVPNFLEAQTRAKLGRTKSDMAVMTMALNRYYTDYGAYPPNTPEVQQYLEAALVNPVMDTTHTSTPKDVKIPWFPKPILSKAEPPPNLDDMSFDEAMDYFSSGGLTRASDYMDPNYPYIKFNSIQLTLLTTPVSYLGSAVPVSLFGRKRYSPFTYVNTADLFTEDTSTSTPGLWGDHITSSTFYYIASEGPSDNFKIWHPLSGPFTRYDATNGTMSEGDLYHFEGYKPEGGPREDKYRPDYIHPPYDPEYPYPSDGMPL